MKFPLRVALSFGPIIFGAGYILTHENLPWWTYCAAITLGIVWYACHQKLSPSRIESVVLMASKAGPMYKARLRCLQCNCVQIVLRRSAKKRADGHIKTMWCWVCRERQDHIEETHLPEEAE